MPRMRTVGCGAALACAFLIAPRGPPSGRAEEPWWRPGRGCPRRRPSFRSATTLPHRSTASRLRARARTFALKGVANPGSSFKRAMAAATSLALARKDGCAALVVLNPFQVTRGRKRDHGPVCALRFDDAASEGFARGGGDDGVRSGKRGSDRGEIADEDDRSRDVAITFTCAKSSLVALLAGRPTRRPTATPSLTLPPYAGSDERAH